MNSKLIIFTSLFMLATHACVSDLNLQIPASDKKAVLNCLLKNDSTIEVRLNWSGDINDTYFEPVTNAQIALFENDKPLDVDLICQTNKVYVADYRVRENCSYQIKVKIGSIVELVAKTISPIEPTIAVKDISTTDSYAYAVKAKSLDKSIAAIYLYLYEWTPNWNFETQTTEGGTYDHIFPYCNSPFADCFNAVMDDWGPDGYFYSYDYFVRVDAEYLRNEEVIINIATWNSSSKQLIKVVSANKDYDRYFKSAYVQCSFDPEINLPFTYYPVPVPSNVEGGLGQMSAVDIQEFVFETSFN